jgi:hypothetical protein
MPAARCVLTPRGGQGRLNRMLTIVSIVIRVNDLAAQTRFWKAALD